MNIYYHGDQVTLYEMYIHGFRYIILESVFTQSHMEQKKLKE